MARETLATLRGEVERLLQCCERYREMITEREMEIDTLRAAAKTSPSAELNHAVRAATIQTAVADLPKFPVLTRVNCTTHGNVLANKHGYCNHCYNYALGKKDQPYARRQN